MERYYVGCDKRGNESYNTNNNNAQKEITGLTRITKKRLKELCKKNKLYQTPALNDVLYLHYQGIDCIECLEEYTGLKCLWLECNAISEIQGLENQKQLKCLFLQSNLIKRIENLESCSELDTLNLASNHIRKIENCGYDVLPVLSTLNLSSNFLKDFDGLKDLENCKTLSVLDLSNNRIDDILVVKIFAKMPQLRVLVLQGNPVVSKLPQYRKTLILECKELTYLDSRPVFPKDRACAEAWKAGGYEGERKEHARWNRMERRKIRDSVNATIRMRNKHKAPEQQDPLFNSSDSEEDETEKKRQRQAELDAGINMELGIWDEVVNEDSKSETSSDMNVSSSTSGLSTTDSNANVSGDTKSMEIQANQDKEEEEKIANNSPETKSQLLDIARDANMGDILKVVGVNATVEDTKETESKDAIKGQKRVFIEEIPEAGLTENDELASSVVERLLDSEIIPAVVEQASTLDRRNSAHSLSDSDDTTKDEYNATVDAICKITMNNLSTPSPKKRIKLQIEVDESLEESDYESERPEKVMETSETEVEELRNITNEAMLPKEKTPEQIKYEQECEEINQKVKEDFEELSTQMDNFFEEMQKGAEGMDVAVGEKDEDASDTESAVSRDTELVEACGDLTLEPAPEKSVAVVMEHVGHLEEGFLGSADGYICGRDQEQGSSGSDVPPEASCVEKVDSPNQFASQLEAMRNDVPGDHADINPQDDDCEKDFGDEKSATDFNGCHEPAITSYEREERDLRQLLQKLEDENEQLYNLNCAYRHVLEEDIRAESKYHEKEDNGDSEEICVELIKDLLDELPPRKPKSHEFGAIESDEEYSYTDPPKPAESPVRTIRDVLSSFNELLQEIARKNREEEERRERENMEAIKRKHASTEAEKAASLNNLLSSPNLRDFNADTSETLDEQIAVEKRRETQRVRKLVDRVYAQKDKYNDSLDVVDGKLVVVKKDTGEIEDLPERKLSKSDSEASDAYESANSDNDEGTAPTRLWDAKVRREERTRGFRLPYRPTERLEALRRLQKEKVDAEMEEEEDKEENEMFYSLEPNKPPTFRNIDEEFIDKLDFEKVVVEKQDEEEAEVKVEIARSYTELKQIVKEHNDSLNLTDDENAMLQKMLGRAEQKTDAGEHAADPLTAEEDELLHKMVQRTKEKEKDKQEAHGLGERELYVKPTLSKQSLKIHEFNNDNNNSNTSDFEDEKKADKFMNIKQLNAQFPIPRAFRDMLDDYDLGTTAPNLPHEEPELNVLYRKETKNHTVEGDEHVVLVRGDFEQPLQMSRGGVLYATYQGQDEEDDEYKDMDTSYDDVLPTSEAEREEDKREIESTEHETAKLISEAGDMDPEQQGERLSVVAESLLKFDGSNYEAYGIDKKTAQGVVEYEKMLNFGYEEEEEFVDAPMEEEELIKIVKEALEKDELKQDENKIGVETKERLCTEPICERSEKRTGVYWAPNEAKEETIQEGSVEGERKETHQRMERSDESNDVTNLDDQGSLGKPSPRSMEGQQLLNEAEFQDLSEEYKDFPVVGSISVETLETTSVPNEPQAKANSNEPVTKLPSMINEPPAPVEEYRDFALMEHSSTETMNAVDAGSEPAVLKEDSTETACSSKSSQASKLSLKRSPTALEKRASLQNLLKSPILQQFNEDTSESLDAQIQAANVEDFDLIECSLQVIGDDDEVVNEISVNAEITYRT